MSCFYCKKRNGTIVCQKDGCEVGVCSYCKTLDTTGGEKWVHCQKGFQYYCQEHLIRSCMECGELSDGCCQCASKSKRGGFRICAKCTVCKKPFVRCNGCKVTLPEYQRIYPRTPQRDELKELNQCYHCEEYFCKDCGEFGSMDMYNDDQVTTCDTCMGPAF